MYIEGGVCLLFFCSEKTNRTVRFNDTAGTLNGVEEESVERMPAMTENLQVEEEGVPSASMLEAMSEDVFDDGQLHELFTAEKSRKFTSEISAARTPEQVCGFFAGVKHTLSFAVEALGAGVDASVGGGDKKEIG